MTTEKVLRYLLIKLPEELKTQIKVEAAKHNKTQSRLVIELLERGLKK